MRNVFLEGLMFLFTLSSFGVLALRNIKITVPEAARVGDSVTLSCDYDLEQVALYTIKWYRYDEEFYRFVPKESPPSKVFQMDHLNVDINRSNSTQVTLTDVDRETSGKFKCEVSADAPLFHTEIRAANLLVADIPSDSPVVKADAYKTAQGTKIRATCTTPGSFPPMNVSWSINDMEIIPSPGIEIKKVIDNYESLPGLDHIRSFLAMNTTQDLFKGGKMKIKCKATMFSLYHRTTETEVQDNNPPTYALVMAAVTTTQNPDGTNEAFRRKSPIFLLYICLPFSVTWFITTRHVLLQ